MRFTLPGSASYVAMRFVVTRNEIPAPPPNCACSVAVVAKASHVVVLLSARGEGVRAVADRSRTGTHRRSFGHRHGNSPSFNAAIPRPPRAQLQASRRL